MKASLTQYGSLLVIDDHNMIVNGVRLLIGERFRDIWHANDGATGLALAVQRQPNLVIVDFVLPDGTGDALVKEIKYRCPATRMLAYSFNGYSAAVLKMFGAGVHGYVIKSEDDEEFVRAVTALLDGKEYFCKEARNHIIHRVFPEEEHPRLIVANTGFSGKEIEIIRLICQQKTAKEISRIVFLSERTVEQYRSNITKRIGARNVAGIIRFALQNHIIDLADL
ncbi:response regulator [Puia dinghuensis]|uniref:DNA-binding response regulator n=1 Tax=Puia dinghuensis TaxID=1792502 RepID=A0A8J2XR86_9BACT|nr:response regulator transcription factor [Puia dinghuensis]GGA99369.1 DNA-binding response regulator [Puia dinghuensis]